MVTDINNILLNIAYMMRSMGISFSLSIWVIKIVFFVKIHLFYVYRGQKSCYFLFSELFGTTDKTLVTGTTFNIDHAQPPR